MNDKKLKINLLLIFDKAPEEAIKYLESLGIAITWDWRQELDAIRNMAFTVSKITNADILQETLNALQNAVKEGTPFEKFKTNFTQVLRNRGFITKEDGSAWRLDTIYRTNLQTTYMSGRFKQMKEVQMSFPYWRFVAVLDSRTSQICRDLNGVILRADDPFWQSNYPPRHFNCRSRVVALNDSLMEQYGYKVSNSEDYKNIKPAEGFDTNPGEWKPDLSKYDKSIQNQLNKEL